MVVKGGEVLEGLCLRRVRLHTVAGEHCTVESDLWLPYPALSVIEYDAILHCSLYELDKVPVILFLDTAIDADVFMDGNDTLEMVSDLAHLHLEDILAHLQAKGHAQEPVPPLVGVKSC